MAETSFHFQFTKPFAMVRRVYGSLPGRSSMAHATVPHFHNTDGLRQIEVGAREFMCVGALPPFDHPHVFLDMGRDSEIVCPYCSTLYVYSSKLAPGTSAPLSAVYDAA